MNKEELVNLNMKDTILDKWKSKLSYPFNQKDLEELENIINYYEEENNQLKEQYCERTDCGGRLGNSKKVEELVKENERLKEENLKLAEENIDLRTYIYVEKASFKSDGKNFYKIMEMPTYEELQEKNQKLKEKNTIYKSTIKGQYNKIKELQNSKRISKDVHKKRNKKLQEENEKLNHYKLLYQKVKDRNDKAVEYIKSNLKYATNPDGVDEPYLDCYECRDLLEILKGNNE